MKYTKKQWAAVNVHSSEDIMRKGDGVVRVTYVPNSPTAQAYWCMTGCPDTTPIVCSVASREYKDSVLKYVKGFAYCITSWERDAWGGWHPEGTMARAAQGK